MNMVVRSFLEVLRTILYGWVIALVLLWRACHRRMNDDRSERDKRASRSHCVPINDPAFVRPDPLIYSQKRLMELGLAVTWDNPDITLYLDGNPVSSHDLIADTLYEVRARCWNDSFDAPAINCKVHLSYLDFGIGTTPIGIASTMIDIGVKGSSTHPAFASIPWRTPAQAGHFCLQVLLDPVDDRDSGNNLGQENTDVKVAASPVPFQFTLQNDGKQARRYRFAVTAYVLRRQKCRGSVPRERLQTHRRDNHPIPPGWTVSISPLTPSLDPGASTPINVVITPPAGFEGRETFNIDAFDEKRAAGGVTLTVIGRG